MTYPRSKRWTRKDLDRMVEQNRIRSFHWPTAAREKRVTMLRRKGKQWYWIAKNLNHWVTERSLHMQTEFKFHATRKWRFDFAIPSVMIAVEYEGIISDKSRHTTITGFTGDADKYNAAAAAGWKVIRLTVLNYKTLLENLNTISA